MWWKAINTVDALEHRLTYDRLGLSTFCIAIMICISKQVDSCWPAGLILCYVPLYAVYQVLQFPDKALVIMFKFRPVR